jgi:hypothetical protein
MIQIFTQNDLIRYIYHEMSEEESDKMAEALLFDDELMDSYQKLRTTKQMVETENLYFEPPRRVVDNILNYSKSFDLHTVDK